MIRDDGIEHSHAAFVKHAHNCFFAFQLVGQRLSQLRLVFRDLDLGESTHMGSGVSDLSRFQPLFQRSLKFRQSKIFTPQARILDTRLGQRAIEIQHADQTGPCS